MMKIQTLQFGEIEIREDSILTFEHGLPGFENLHRFTVLTPDPELPFSFLQAVDDGNTAFVLTDPFLFYPEYEFDVPEEVQQQLQIIEGQELTIWAIVSVREELAHSTLNLMAPVLINGSKRLGRQCILHGSGYSTQHPLHVKAETAATAEEGDAHARINT
ncbi:MULTISPECIES: flagellar assembly protein FliW [Paenibacillus]|uniref:Flagellar assembly factor FliW n=1 Tax=Paenibacillus oceani TaxID=2772510 RepID=A0A927CBF7_9BACL|nr:flagellar assembly protein FliW [Paenibacillus oceani]MBD2863637.1 flagellar assembly protein FliW [Paenibacillus oceani]